MNTCRGCDADVIFVPSAASGKPMILDAKPSNGIVIRGESGFGERYVPGSDLSQDAVVVDVYTDHHATCPKAEEFRRSPVGGGRED